MSTGSVCRLCAVFCCVLTVLPATTADTVEKQVTGRRSRQAEEEGLEGVWGPWSEWVECSQTCGVGVSERRRQCMPPPQTPPLVWNRPAYPGVISAVRPYYNSLYPGNESPPYGAGVAERSQFFSPPNPANQNPTLPLYRNEAGGAGPAQFDPSSQEPVSVYRSSSFLAASSSSSFLPYGRIPGRTSSQGAGRSVGSGSRRSSSSIRPGQFGYGRVPFSLPLHRQNRHVRHHNSTTTDSPDVLDVNPNLREDKTEEDAEASITDVTKINKEQKEKRKREKDRVEMETQAVTVTTERGDDAAERPSDAETHRRPEIMRGRERVTHSQSLTQRQSHAHVARDRRVDSRASRQVPHSYTQTIHRAQTPRKPSSYSLPLPHIQTPTNSNPEPWVLQNGSQPPRNEAERGWGLPAHSYKCSGRDREYRRCSLQACPGAPVNPRAEQCAAFNSQEFMGRVYDWEPFTEG
ncbi:ADAMTS-like protein 4 [Triplophysa rosa]|uniref:ADAMTS-like protein 4 n=1 Tax=Triplophysa rosa TaxID=992332 RepID=UPI002545D71B|nr:ADAMTS-like protein 4 [Triplophysa rosa]